MRFFARIIPNSTVDRAWRAHHRTGGSIENVEFRLNPGAVVLAANPMSGTYLSEELTGDQVAVLRSHNSVHLEGLSVLPALIEAAATVTQLDSYRKAERSAPVAAPEAPAPVATLVTPTPAPHAPTASPRTTGSALVSSGGSPSRKKR
jgi:hypothetical protein